MDNIRIELAEPGTEDSLFGRDELWITVSGPDPLPDFHQVRTLVRQRFKRDDVPVQPLRYFPSWGGPDEDYSEMWVCRKQEVSR